MLGNSGQWFDLGYRAIHEMTRKSQAIVEAFYGKSADYSYSTGCSGGGQQGLAEAQRYPADYDGTLQRGPGPGTFDALAALQQWMEEGVAPEQILSTHLTNGQVDLSRPLCSNPQAAECNAVGSDTYQKNRKARDTVQEVAARKGTNCDSTSTL